jgi:hypothetical protein
VQLGKRRVPKDLRTQLGYQVQINPGSIELLVKFLLEHKEFLAVFAADGGHVLSEAVVRLLRDAIDLRKKAAELIKKGLTINIHISNSFNVGSRLTGNNIYFDNTKGSIFISDPKILWAAQVTRSPLDDVLSNVDGRAVEYIEIDSKESALRLTESDRDIIGQHKEELPTTLTIVGRLDMVAFTSHKGSIISNDERFSVTWDENIRQKMQKIADIEGVLFKVRPIVDHKRLDTNAIGFHVLDCGDPQEKMFS